MIFLLIELELEGINKDIVEKLEKAGFSVGMLAISNIDEIVSKTGIDSEDAKKVLDSAQDQLGIHPITATQYLEIERKRGKITTSSTELDSMLGGGVATAEITELAGAFSSGKTQLCFQLCINVQSLKEEGGLEGKAFFIDTERTFSPQRIAEMATSRQLNVNEILDNILIAPAPNTHVMFSIIEQLETNVESDQKGV